MSAPPALFARRPMVVDSRLYDVFMRLPIVSFTLFFFGREIIALRGAIAVRLYASSYWQLFFTVAARISLMMFLALLAALHLSRLRPVRKYGTWWPKITALLGLLTIYALVMVPAAESIAWWDGLSTMLLLVGNMLGILVVLDLGHSLSIMPEARRLVTSGCYRRIRHPLYLAEDIALVGVFLQYRSWPAAIVLTAHLLVQLRRMDWEEDILFRAFPEYADYRLRSYRLVPGFY
jgi:protein-S-isoprenylcysteine O-methyltransferase Ste14